PPSGKAIAALAACDVAFGADDLAGIHGGDVLAKLDHLADELVADDESWFDAVLRPLVPRVDVEVRAANTRAQHADENLTGTGLGLGHVLQPQPGLGLRLDQRLHRDRKRKTRRPATTLATGRPDRGGVWLEVGPFDLVG